eukprot:TRINITY_DN90682_c0_g1_i1.p1 TRINITY_DN90682_c0_g1~~TRINITY_DN90682_c0_g1_i1.p1  ORF type:complete len:588 (-),score=134.32 TRINITY_DN90682_c0_g1_i1:78-1841(-)
MSGQLGGRTVHEVTDLSLQEQLYLYERTRRFKARKRDAPEDAPALCEVVDANEEERMDNPDSTVYLIFMEGSTRTRESLRNAAVYHGVKVNEFQAETSSFQKNETITDTMKMLAVYSTERSVFVIRSELEGVCSWLKGVMSNHAQRFGIPAPAFLNAGDGAYTHPLGEFADIFSLLEKKQWDRSSVHLALVGDLAHGRTAHSKVEGLKIFQKVRVDLVAPEIFGYPVEYRNRMRRDGFEVREYSSVEEYLSQAEGSIAEVWYFYKPQFKKCGDIPQVQLDLLRSQVSFREEWLQRLPKGCGFFQTLPRDKENPIIPLSFDSKPINTWDTVAANAYFLDVVLLSMLFGKIGKGLTPPVKAQENQAVAEAAVAPRPVFSAELPSFIKAIDLGAEGHKRNPERARSGGPVPIKDGLVIDHIGVGTVAASCWDRLRMVRTILGWAKYIGSEGVYVSRRAPSNFKGIMTLPNFDYRNLKVQELKMLASVAPGCTINCVAGDKVAAKYRLQVPERIYDLPNISCKNVLCVSNPKNRQRDVKAYMERVPYYETSVLPNCKATEFLYVCKYCRWPHVYESIWDVLQYQPRKVSTY